MKVLIDRYLYSNKEDNWDIADQFNDDSLKYLAYEVKLTYEYDVETKEDAKLLAVNDTPLDHTLVLNRSKIKDWQVAAIEDKEREEYERLKAKFESPEGGQGA
tara:strand:+ start:4989 stop:5297 length:309 start_codon:yes stop_codon:yes gene_type:complete